MIKKVTTTHHTKKHIIISAIWLIFCSICIFQAIREGKVYDNIYSNKEIYNSENIQQETLHIKKTITANEAIKNKNYETALTLISGNTSEDYYNRWTIQTLLAYKNGLQKNISWRESAKIFITQAQNSFDIAQKLSPSKSIQNAIHKNKNNTDILANIINIKTCYGIGQQIITSIHTTQNISQDIKKILKEEEKHLAKKHYNIDNECHQKLKYIMESSKEQINLLQWEMEYNKQKYVHDISEKIEDPLLCIELPYQNILASLTQGNLWLKKYQEGHQNIIDAFEKGTKESIDEICKENKNDAEINQDIENSVQDMLEKLSNTQEKREEKKQNKKNSQTIQYKNFFTEKETKELKEIQDINQIRIENTLKTRGKWNYEAERYINNMFNQFHGNSWDFINLHK